MSTQKLKLLENSLLTLYEINQTNESILDYLEKYLGNIYDSTLYTDITDIQFSIYELLSYCFPHNIEYEWIVEDKESIFDFIEQYSVDEENVIDLHNILTIWKQLVVRLLEVTKISVEIFEDSLSQKIYNLIESYEQLYDTIVCELFEDENQLIRWYVYESKFGKKYSTTYSEEDKHNVSNITKFVEYFNTMREQNA